MRTRRYVNPILRARQRLGLGSRALLVAAFGVLALMGSLAVFGGATEDVTQHDGLATHDAARLRLFTVHRSDLVVRASKLFSTIGDPPVLAVLALLAAFLFWRRGLRLAVALAPTIALCVSAVAVALTKTIVGRARPPVSLHLVPESDASFPSGHATDSAAVFIAIALVLAVFVLRRPIAQLLSVVAGASLAGAIGTSRLILGVHWPSDVLAGLALGVGISIVATITAALCARLTPPPLDQSTRRRRSWARVAQLLTRERQVGREQHLRAA
jgi:membrane-associated phospholipid phosphatase